VEDGTIRRGHLDLCEKKLGQISMLKTGKRKRRAPAYLHETKLATLLKLDLMVEQNFNLL
jgi:hypothetical protein